MQEQIKARENILVCKEVVKKCCPDCAGVITLPKTLSMGWITKLT